MQTSSVLETSAQAEAANAKTSTKNFQEKKLRRKTDEWVFFRFFPFARNPN